MKPVMRIDFQKVQGGKNVKYYKATKKEKRKQEHQPWQVHLEHGPGTEGSRF